MGDAEDAPTGMAPTELGGAVEETEAHTAWSLDSGEEWPVRRSWVPVIAAVGAAAVVAVGVGVFAWTELRSGEQATSSSSATPPPPVTVTTVFEAPVTSPTGSSTRAAVPEDEVNPDDARLLNTLRGWGWVIDNPYEVVERARRLCVNLHASKDVVAVKAQVVAEAAALGDSQPEATANDLMNAAIGIYPDCP